MCVQNMGNNYDSIIVNKELVEVRIYERDVLVKLENNIRLLRYPWSVITGYNTALYNKIVNSLPVDRRAERFYLAGWHTSIPERFLKVTFDIVTIKHKISRHKDKNSKYYEMFEFDYKVVYYNYTKALIPYLLFKSGNRITTDNAVEIFQYHEERKAKGGHNDDAYVRQLLQLDPEESVKYMNQKFKNIY